MVGNRQSSSKEVTVATALLAKRYYGSRIKDDKMGKICITDKNFAGELSYFKACMGENINMGHTEIGCVDATTRAYLFCTFSYKNCYSVPALLVPKSVGVIKVKSDFKRSSSRNRTLDLH